MLQVMTLSVITDTCWPLGLMLRRNADVTSLQISVSGSTLAWSSPDLDVMECGVLVIGWDTWGFINTLLGLVDDFLFYEKCNCIITQFIFLFDGQ